MIYRQKLISCLLVLNLFFFNCYESANILFLLTAPSPSHIIWHKPLIQKLGESGHNITLVTPYEDARGVANGVKNHTLIYLEGLVEYLWGSSSIDLSDHEAVIDNPMDNQGVLDFIADLGIFSMKNKGFQMLYEYPDNLFDVILIDVFMLPTNYYPLLNKIGSNTPIIATCPNGWFPFINTLMSEYAYPAIAPQNDGPLGTQMSFSERLSSFISYIKIFGHIYLKTLPLLKSEAEKLMNGGKPYDIEEFYRPQERISAVLLNDDPLFTFPRPASPTSVEVGGIHISPKVQPLPKDLQQFMDENKSGVVLFSLGSNLDSGDMKPEKFSALMKVFTELPYGVVFKCKKKLDFVLPKNIFVKDWLPIASILAHKNTKVFITHSGALSTQEAFYYGVPMIGIPVIADQIHNIHLAIRKGVGEMLPYKDISENNLKNVLSKVLNNPSYASNARRLSQLYRDQQNSPLNRGVFWVEYILKHGIVKELHMATKQLNIFQMYCLDLIAFLLAILVVATWALKKLIYFLLSYICSSSKKLKKD